ncbi:DUF397 domain-containing protein [Nocardiopsis sp. NRRL B-16309]|uniref:DUF397 domain-containing protein n=1 Tax=Nocardiopsis sp. NRRL B-16309 TaxID=1519494 RepID=UPI0006AFD821|nr:DUF397 domain-containing protein [Nocardiopsis sp. NRRL B-16309]KOX16147.1 hypothetical protein ADL05_13200 [Nocardiopsis sp. NRRL B-16309]
MVSEWHKSSYSGGNNECVEVREHSTGADVRDTQHRDAAHLTFSSREWQHFLTPMKHQAR